jgi:hypothetical protein
VPRCQGARVPGWQGQRAGAKGPAQDLVATAVPVTSGCRLCSGSDESWCVHADRSATRFVVGQCFTTFVSAVLYHRNCARLRTRPRFSSRNQGMKRMRSVGRGAQENRLLPPPVASLSPVELFDKGLSPLSIPPWAAKMLAGCEVRQKRAPVASGCSRKQPVTPGGTALRTISASTSAAPSACCR